ncbi:hypothetical protein DFJ63DRAFT_214373 [Scheffersomyces coipomensis]|uniref:uncharacterized protein n=1 Tax=Scheffersomyces coipomensis TaxID=1788519 RepID=UPI00315D5300
MKLFTLWIIASFLYAQQTSAVLFRGKTDYKRPSALVRAYNDNKNIKTVKSYDQVSTADLYKYGIIRIEDDKSLIVSESLANQLTKSDKTKGHYDPERDYYSSSEKMKKSDKFVQISFENIKTKTSDNVWSSLGGCRHNRSNQKSSYKQGYSVDANAGTSGSLKWTLPLGLTPILGLEVTAGGTLSGSIGCDVGPKETLLAQIRTTSIKVSGLKQRTLKLGYFSHYFPLTPTYLRQYPYKPIKPFHVNQRNKVQLKCMVNKKENLKCPKLGHQTSIDDDDELSFWPIEEDGNDPNLVLFEDGDDDYEVVPNMVTAVDLPQDNDHFIEYYHDDDAIEEIETESITPDESETPTETVSEITPNTTLTTYYNN